MRRNVAAGGHADKPAAVCGATWRDKPWAEKALATAMETPMATKKKHRKHGKHKPKKQTKHRGKSHTKGRRTAPRTAHRKDQHQHKCPACGHLARHDPKAGCTHFEGHRFCPCRHRHR
jgi:hypothetical protein